MKLLFCRGLGEQAIDTIIRYYETEDLSDFELIEGESGHGLVYRLSVFPYIIKVYKEAGLNHQDHLVLQQVLDCPFVPQLYAYVINMAHSVFLNFLYSMESYQLFDNLSEAKRVFWKLKNLMRIAVLLFFLKTDCRDIRLVFEQREK